MLGENAFGNFRELLEDVALHPMMGIYLTWLGNQKEDPTTGRVPDLNFARESHAAVLDRLVQAQPRRHAACSAPTASRSPAYDRRRPRRHVAGVHRLELVRRPEPDRPHDAPLLRPRRGPDARLAADAGLQRVRAEHVVPLDQREELPRRRRSPAQTKADTGRRPEDRARHAVQPPERRPVHRQAADPAPGHQQPEPGLRGRAWRPRSTTTAAACAAT